MTPLKPQIPAPLDPEFQPSVLLHRDYLRKAEASRQAAPLIIGMERENGLLARYETAVLPDPDAETLLHVERLVKFLLWSRGAWRIWIGGPEAIGSYIRQCYAPEGTRRFDVDLMQKVYEKSFAVEVVDVQSVPGGKERDASLGGHLEGYRIGFDLGASDYKIAAVKNGAVVYSGEFPWNPKDQKDPDYHFQHLNAGLKQAAAHLPRVDAIGGSSAGVIVDNRIMAASLFRSIPASEFHRAQNLFLRIQDAWKVPVEVANDGDVTALAGALSLRTGSMLGIAMGSSEAAGYINPHGCMTGWLNELAFAPVDGNPHAAVDEWSGDYGVGGLYFSQQAVNKLLPSAGVRLPDAMPLPDRLKEIQQIMMLGDDRSVKIYETIGVYLGYAIPYYAEFYDFRHVLILGRVTTGAGGGVIMEKAGQVLTAEFPELSEKTQLHVPDENNRRVGQAVAAASLPVLTGTEKRPIF